MPISPGPAANSGGLETRTSDPDKAGRLKSAIDGANAAPGGAQSFEKRVTESGIAH